MGACCAVVRPSWASWSDLWASRSLPGPPWGHLGALLARLGAFRTPEKPRDKPQERPKAPGNPGVQPLKNLESWLQQQPRSCVSLGALHFEPRARWRIGPSWRPLGRSWSDLGGLLGRFGPSEGRKEANAKIFQMRKDIVSCLLLRAFLEDLLEASRAVLEASWGLLGPSWAILEPSWAVLVACWADLDASWIILGRLRCHIGLNILGELGGYLRPCWPSLGRFGRKPCPKINGPAIFGGFPGGRRAGPKFPGEIQKN